MKIIENIKKMISIESRNFYSAPVKKMTNIIQYLKEEEYKKEQEQNVIHFQIQLKTEILKQHYIDKREKNQKNQKTNNFTRFFNILNNAILTHQAYLKEQQEKKSHEEEEKEELVDDYYDIQYSIGCGNFGWVQKAINKETGQQIAIKGVSKKDLDIASITRHEIAIMALFSIQTL
jgi:hypothetical protein